MTLYSLNPADEICWVRTHSEAAYPLRQAIEDEQPDVYQLATKLPATILLQVWLQKEYDETYHFSRSGPPEAIFLPRMLEILDEYDTDYHLGPSEGQILVPEPAFQTFCDKAIVPLNSPELRTILAKGFDTEEAWHREWTWHMPEGRVCAEGQRARYRSAAAIIPFEELGVEYYHEQTQTRFPSAYVEKLTHSILYGAQFLYRPCAIANLEARFRCNHVIGSYQSFEAFQEPVEVEAPGSFLIFAKCSETHGSSAIRFTRSDRFLVLDVFEFQKRTQVTLVHMPDEAVDFFRSMRMRKLDEVIAAARQHARKSAEKEPRQDSVSAEQSPQFDDPFHWNKWKFSLSPLRA